MKHAALPSFLAGAAGAAAGASSATGGERE